MAEDREVTIYDIAKYLNISAATVSRGLKNNPMISKQTRKKITDAATMLGYQSNTFASSLRSRQTHTLGVLVPRLNSHFMSSVLAGMENAANLHGYNLIIAQSLEDVDKEKRNVLTMYNKRVDGLLISLSANATDINHLEPFFKKQIPVVFFDRVHSHADSTCVGIDNYDAAYHITTHLISQGCKRIMHLGGNLLRNVYNDRFKGYKKALKEHHLPFSAALHLVSNLSEQAGTDAASYILELPPAERPDAVFSANDTAAVYCMLALKAAGLRIPEDIAFAGFNNDPISKVIEPNLTTMNYSGEAIGNTAATYLINHLKGSNNLHATNAITLRADLVIRASSLKKDTAG
ncbi:LacI family DNA-binding transcriptional regulator [Chitinophaga sp. sic0106]|uniref:LacI family DNA-binding transcriptional regulator n=1 Tax=Chitinophaga sp. sic0106 TaxID=2854785 RepID=UPI001C450B12|nr:LacI family DNA-binding transcriptional regulator [Chitinophaga sp. sic0106]MBV7530378.1 LacI family transcriptional regulator [Chitinophaga sp. sic0106]